MSGPTLVVQVNGDNLQRVQSFSLRLAVTELAVRRDAALAWLAVYFAESRAALAKDHPQYAPPEPCPTQ